MKTVLKRLLGFTGFPLLSLIAPFLILPIISRTVDGAGWANYTAGQSIGVLAAIATLFGWGVLGPVRIATAKDEAARQGVYRESLHTRFLVGVIVAPLAVTVTVLVTSASYQLESVLMTLSGLLIGLGPNWFCIGIGKPMLMGKYDAIPRLIASFAAIPVIWATGWVWLYPAVLMLVSIGSIFFFTRMVLRGAAPERFSFGKTLAALRFLLPTALIDLTGNSYGSTPVPIATATLSHASAGSFSSAERLYRISIMSVTALGDAFQGWVLEPDATSRLKRHMAAIVAHATLGLLGGAAIAAFAPAVTGFVFGADVAATFPQALFFGLSLLFISATTPLIRNVLIPAGKYRQVFTATMVAAVAGLAIMISFGISGSSAGIAAGLAASEVLIFLVLLPSAVIHLRAITHEAPNLSQA